MICFKSCLILRRRHSQVESRQCVLCSDCDPEYSVSPCQEPPAAAELQLQVHHTSPVLLGESPL